MLRGTKTGLEFVFAGEGFAEASADVVRRLEDRPEFYRGSRGTAIFVAEPPESDAFAEFADAVSGLGVDLFGIYGDERAERLAQERGLQYLGVPPVPPVTSFERKRAARAAAEVALTDGARSLDADFAGARADIARRRARGEPSVPRPNFAQPVAAAPSPPAAVASLPAEPSTLYHRGTLRGGQALQQLGNIVVIGDVNPGAELTASGDILVFGALRGTAHAGAQGDTTARVFALELAPTQLRIATLIAADAELHAREPEVAYVESDRIAIGPAQRAGARA